MKILSLPIILSIAMTKFNNSTRDSIPLCDGCSVQIDRPAPTPELSSRPSSDEHSPPGRDTQSSSTTLVDRSRSEPSIHSTEHIEFCVYFPRPSLPLAHIIPSLCWLVLLTRGQTVRSFVRPVGRRCSNRVTRESFLSPLLLPTAIAIPYLAVC